MKKNLSKTIPQKTIGELHEEEVKFADPLTLELARSDLIRSIVEEMRVALKDEDISFAQLADLIGVDKSTVSRQLSINSNPTIGTVAVLMAAIDHYWEFGLKKGNESAQVGRNYFQGTTAANISMERKGSKFKSISRPPSLASENA